MPISVIPVISVVPIIPMVVSIISIISTSALPIATASLLSLPITVLWSVTETHVLVSTREPKWTFRIRGSKNKVRNKAITALNKKYYLGGSSEYAHYCLPSSPIYQQVEETWTANEKVRSCA